MAESLTKPQVRALVVLSHGEAVGATKSFRGPYGGAVNTRTADRLEDLGLARWVWTNGQHRVRLTEAGRRWLDLHPDLTFPEEVGAVLSARSKLEAAGG